MRIEARTRGVEPRRGRRPVVESRDLGETVVERDRRDAGFAGHKMIAAVAIPPELAARAQLVDGAGDLAAVVAAEAFDDVAVEPGS